MDTRSVLENDTFLLVGNIRQCNDAHLFTVIVVVAVTNCIVY